jgi:hypothetical protein
MNITLLLSLCNYIRIIVFNDMIWKMNEHEHNFYMMLIMIHNCYYNEYTRVIMIIVDVDLY